VQTIPKGIAPDLRAVVSGIAARERELIQLCTQPDFSIEKLASALNT